MENDRTFEKAPVPLKAHSTANKQTKEAPWKDSYLYRVFHEKPRFAIDKNVGYNKENEPINSSRNS